MQPQDKRSKQSRRKKNRRTSPPVLLRSSHQSSSPNTSPLTHSSLRRISLTVSVPVLSANTYSIIPKSSFMLVFRAEAKAPVAVSNIPGSRLMRSTPWRNFTISRETKRLMGTR